MHWPDGRTTAGIEPHIADLKAMFVYAPDTYIKEHPIKIASGEWKAVTGIIEGTFGQPMPIGDGRTIPPTGKPFRLSMVTIGRWKNGVMAEEWLFWDNQRFMMFYREHEPVHFHAEYQGQQASFDLEGEVVAGSIRSRTALRLIREWAALHRVEILANWLRMKAGEPLEKIEPLE